MTKSQKYNIGGLLYLISKAPKEGFPFRIRLQKLMLLGKLEFYFPFDLKYSSYFYGPYAPQIQRILDELSTAGFISEEARELSENQFGYYYSLTKKGELILRDLKIPKEKTAKLDKLWDKYKDFSTGALIKSAKEISGIKSIDE